MRIGEVRVRVRLRLVAVPVAVPRALSEGFVVGVTMVLVVQVFMLVLQRFVRVLVLMPFGQMKPHAQCHEGARDNESHAYQFAEQGNRNDRAEEGSDREIRSSTGCSEETQRHDE